MDIFSGFDTDLFVQYSYITICFITGYGNTIQFCVVIVKRYIEQVGSSEGVTVLRNGRTL